MIRETPQQKIVTLHDVKNVNSSGIYKVRVTYNTPYDINTTLTLVWGNRIISPITTEIFLSANKTELEFTTVTSLYEETQFHGIVHAVISPRYPKDLVKPQGLMAALEETPSKFEQLKIKGFEVKTCELDIMEHIKNINIDHLLPVKDGLDTPIIMYGFYLREDGLGAHMFNLYDNVFRNFKNVSFYRAYDRIGQHFRFLQTIDDFSQENLNRHIKDFEWLKLYLTLENAHAENPEKYKNAKFIHVSGIDIAENIFTHTRRVLEDLKNKYNIESYFYLMWESTGVDLLQPLIEMFDHTVITNSWLHEHLQKEYPKATIDKLEHIAHYSILENNPPTDKITFGYSGGLWERKKVDKIIESFNVMKSENDFLAIHSRDFVNTPEMVEHLESILALDSKNISFQNETLIFEDYLAWWKNLSAYIFISAGEGYSVTPRQALLCGIPVILSRNTAHLDLIDVPGILWVNSHEASTARYSGNITREIKVGEQYEPDVAHAAKQLLELKENYAYYKAQALLGKEIIKQQVHIDSIKEQWVALTNNTNE
jgi:glycosyltransferase involved in cell wall biosynthesis